MSDNVTKGEIHGCIVCGKSYQLYVVYDANGKFVDFKIMSSGAKPVAHPLRALVACEQHDKDQIEAAVARVFDAKDEDEDD